MEAIMLLLTHKPKPISLARQRREALEASSSESCNSREYFFSDPYSIPEGSIVVDLGTSDVLENCMILLDSCLDVGVDGVHLNKRQKSSIGFHGN